MNNTPGHTNERALFVPRGHGLQQVEVGHTFVASLQGRHEVTGEGATKDEAVANLIQNVSVEVVEVRDKFIARLKSKPEVTAEGATEDKAVSNLRARVSLSVIQTGEIE